LSRELGGPRLLGRTEIELEVVRREQRLAAEQGEEPMIIFDTVDGVILRDSAIDQESVQPAVVFVFVT